MHLPGAVGALGGTCERRRERRGELRQVGAIRTIAFECLQDGQPVSGNVGDTTRTPQVRRERLRKSHDAGAGECQPRKQRPVRIDGAVRRTSLDRELGADQPEHPVLVLCQPQRPGVAEKQLHTVGVVGRTNGDRDDVRARGGLGGDQDVQQLVDGLIVIVEEDDPVCGGAGQAALS